MKVLDRAINLILLGMLTILTFWLRAYYIQNRKEVKALQEEIRYHEQRLLEHAQQSLEANPPEWDGYEQEENPILH